LDKEATMEEYDKIIEASEEAYRKVI